MDSLTQVVLGAAVSVAVSGRRIGARKAALLGAGIGTLPDLDVLVRHGDPVRDFILHRGWSHSLLVHAAVTPVLAEAAIRVFKGSGTSVSQPISPYFCASPPMRCLIP